jgi:hypothetical protein
VKYAADRYKVGDRVRFIDGQMWPDLAGLTGIVVDAPFAYAYSVQLDAPNPFAGCQGLPCAWASDIEPADADRGI